MSALFESKSSSAAFWCAAIILAAAAALAFHLAPQVPFGLPYDEWVKVQAIRNGTQNFQHPILMLQFVRAMNWFAGAHDDLAIAQLGRFAAALSGGLLVFFTILLARRALDAIPAIGAGLLTAVPPLTVVHAQLLKEDIFVAPWLILGLFAIDRLRESPEWRRAIFLGIVAGFAASAKYLGAVLLPLSLLAPLFVPTPSSRAYWKMAGVAVTVTFITFCAINFPAFIHPEIFFKGLGYELKHVVNRHLIVNHGWYSYFLFTLTANLWPGLLAPIAVTGLAGAVLTLLRWRETHPALRLVLLFGIVWYLLHELSPMKPHPEGARHMVVMAAVFAVLSASVLDRIAEKFASRWQPIAAAGLVLLLAAYPTRASFVLVRSAPNDTDLAVGRAIAAMAGESVMRAQHTRLVAKIPRLDLVAPLNEVLATNGFLATNEIFAMDFARSAQLGRQSRRGKHYASVYCTLLQRPALRITSAAGAHAYRNIPFRIVALQGDPERLKQAAAALSPAPDIVIEMLPGRSNIGSEADPNQRDSSCR